MTALISAQFFILDMAKSMQTYNFRLLNIFAESRFAGNPLCVFEDARGLSGEQMQQLAKQFNLSETSFLLPSDSATAKFRIFTTTQELAFAGHPSLGTAHVVRDLFQANSDIFLECEAGIVKLLGILDRWVLTMPDRGGVRTYSPATAPEDIAAMLGISTVDLISPPQFVDTGNAQLLLPLNSVEAVRRASPNPAYVDRWPQTDSGRKVAYVFAFEAEPGNLDQSRKVCSRYFYVNAAGNVLEDPGTGSAAANLGGWWIANNYPLPARFAISQGEQAGRPCQLHVEVTVRQEIKVSGNVVEIGRGSIQI